MKHTPQTVKYNINLAKKRLNVFSSRTGKKFELDEDYFTNLSPAEADKKLKAIRWSNTNQKKGGVSYKGLIVDDEPARRRRIVREKPKKPRKDHTQQKEITRAINKAEARLKTATKHTGLSYKIDRDLIRSMDHDEALRTLEYINYKNMASNPDKVLNYIKSAYSRGTHPLSKLKYNVKIEKANELTKAIIEREKVWGEVKPARIYSQTAQDKVLEYYNKYNTFEKKAAFIRQNAELAENNLKQNFKRIASSGTDIVSDVAQVILDLYNEGILTIDNTPQQLHEVSEIDMYDSEVDEKTLINSAERIIQALIFYSKISKSEIRRRLKEMGNSEEDIDEIITI